MYLLIKKNHLAKVKSARHRVQNEVGIVAFNFFSQNNFNYDNIE